MISDKESGNHDKRTVSALESTTKRGQPTEASTANKKTKTGDEQAPTIQIQFALGDMTDNPVMQLLQPDTEEKDDDESSQDKDNNQVLAEEEAGKERAVRTLLTGTSSSTIIPPKEPKRKKPLITEL